MKPNADYLLLGLLCMGSFWLGGAIYQNHWAEPENPLSISRASPSAISATTLTGEPREIDAEDLNRPTLLLVLSADCRYCEQNAATWRELIVISGESATPPEVIALSLSDAKDTERYLEDNHLEVPVLLIDQAELAALGLRGVPGTIALDPGSETMRSWIGVLHESETATILTWARAD